MGYFMSFRNEGQGSCLFFLTVFFFTALDKRIFYKIYEFLLTVQEVQQSRDKQDKLCDLFVLTISFFFTKREIGFHIST